MNEIPELRIRLIHDAEVRPGGEFVLYWMTTARRGKFNFGLQQAVQWAQQLEKPLLMVEPLRCDYGWASDRFHRFHLQGMMDNEEHFNKRPACYHPFVETEPGQSTALLEHLAADACVVVGDDFPQFMPQMKDVAAAQVAARFEVVDSNGLLPMRAAEKVFARAFDLRRFLQKHLLPHLAEVPQEDPLESVQLPAMTKLPVSVTERWPRADLQALLESSDGLSELPIDLSVPPVKTVGGARAAEDALKQFLQRRIAIYDSGRNQPEQHAASGLSPYLHHGHISTHQIFDAVTRYANWTPNKVSDSTKGSASGWWGADENVESFLDELITWRELGYNTCSKLHDFDQYDSLPNWAKATLAEHAADERPHCYSLTEFENSETHDELWNAAQRQLVRTGIIHNYLRMLWGKKILEWSESPQSALQIMIELNNKYALDGQNPNSYSGIFWVLGRHDRAWGPERPIFGKVRYMSSENTARKLKLKQYLAIFGPESLVAGAD